MAIIKALKDQRYKKLNKILQEISTETEKNGKLLGEGIKRYADWITSWGEDDKLVRYTRDKNKNKKIIDISTEKLKRNHIY